MVTLVLIYLAILWVPRDVHRLGVRIYFAPKRCESMMNWSRHYSGLWKTWIKILAQMSSMTWQISESPHCFPGPRKAWNSSLGVPPEKGKISSSSCFLQPSPHWAPFSSLCTTSEARIYFKDKGAVGHQGVASSPAQTHSWSAFWCLHNKLSALLGKERPGVSLAEKAEKMGEREMWASRKQHFPWSPWDCWPFTCMGLHCCII